MNIVILKNRYEFENLPREKLFDAHLVGYWNNGGTLTICKDRFYGRIGNQIHEEELSSYIERFSVDNTQRVTQTEINEKK
jgi:hypothetical protein